MDHRKSDLLPRKQPYIHALHSATLSKVSKKFADLKGRRRTKREKHQFYAIVSCQTWTLWWMNLTVKVSSQDHHCGSQLIRNWDKWRRGGRMWRERKWGLGEVDEDQNSEVHKELENSKGERLPWGSLNNNYITTWKFYSYSGNQKASDILLPLFFHPPLLTIHV